jgi:ribosomal protein L37AE/L43A
MRKVECTVRRPDGTLETIIHPVVKYMTTALLAKMNEAMKKANRGEVISYKNISDEIELTHTHKCDRCGATVDSTAYSQTETAYLGSSRIKVTAYYCNHCEALLKGIGAGEVTAMQERSSGASYEPYTKSDE